MSRTCHKSRARSMMSCGMSDSQLSDRHKEALKQSWSLLESEKEDLAVKIFILIFEQCPQAKQLFHFSNKPEHLDQDLPKELKKNKEFRFHALRFIQIIQNAVEMLEDFEALEPVLSNLGQMHARFQQTRGFHIDYWYIFVECTIFVFRKNLATKQKFGMEKLDEAIEGWRFILGAIVRDMKVGYEAGVNNRMEISRTVALENNPKQKRSESCNIETV